MSTSVPDPLACPAPARSRAVRYVFAVLGLACFALGAVGVFVPGLPTTIFLIVGSYFLTRSCPWLERRLMESRLFRPYARYLAPGATMPRRARVTAIALMTVAIVGSAWLLHARGALGPWLGSVLALCLVTGTVAVLRFRREPTGNQGAAPIGETLTKVLPEDA